METNPEFQIDEYETLPKAPLYKPEPPSTDFDNPATSSLVSEFKNRTANLMPSDLLGAQDFSAFNALGTDQRLNVVTQGPDKSAFTELSDGTLVPRLDAYNTALNTQQNEALLEQGQTTSQKWGRGLYTHLFKGLGTKIVGGTVGAVNGAIEAVKLQSLSAMYDNDLTRYLSDIDKTTQASNAIYKQAGFEDLNFGQKLLTADFLADELLGGISFLAGTIISESIWGVATGGTGLIAKGLVGATGRAAARLGAGKSMGKIMNLAKKEGNTLVRGTAKNATKNMRAAGITAGKTQEVLNTTRFLYTSAGYESSVEALGFMEEAEAMFINESLKKGSYPSPEELAQFKLETTSAGNAVFGTNMALVGFSNLTVLGKTLLGKSTNRKLSNSFFKKTFFGAGYTKEGGKLMAKESTRMQRNFSRAFSVGQKAFTEGVIEEGGQSATGGAALKYVMSGYDEDATNDNISAIDSMYKGLAETFTSKSGLTEVGLGVLIGVLGGGMSTRYQFNEYIQEGERTKTIVKHVNSYTSKQLVDTMKMSNKINMANKAGDAAEASGDLTGKMSADTAHMTALAERAFRYQGVDETIQDLQVALDEMPLDIMAKEMGISEEEAATWKSEKMLEFSDTMREHGKNLQYAQAILGGSDIAGLTQMEVKDIEGSKEDLESAIAYTLTMGKRSDEFAEAMATQIKQMVAFEMQPEEITDAITVNGILRKVNAKAQSTYAKSRARVNDLAEKGARLEQELIKAQTATEVVSEGKASAKANKISKINKALIDVQQRLAEAQDVKTASYNALNIPQYTQDIVTEDMLDNQANNVKQLESSMKNIEMRDPQQAAILSKVFAEYGKAVRQTKAFNDVIQGIVNPKVRVTTLNGLLSSMLNKRKKLNEPTEAFFASAMSNWIEGEVKAVGVAGVGTSNFDEDEEENPNPLDKAPEDVSEELDKKAADNVPPPAKQKPAVEVIKQQINDVVNKDPYTATRYNGELNTTLDEVKPTQEEIDRYNELLDKMPEGFDKQSAVIQNINPLDSGLTNPEFGELKALTGKLNNWQLLNGFGENGSSLAEMLQLVDQLEQPFVPSATQPEVQVRDFFAPEGAETKKDTNSYTPLNTIISPTEAVAKKTKGKYQLSHIKIESIDALFPGRLFVKDGNKLLAIETIPEDKMVEYNQTPGTEVVLQIGGEGVLNFVTDDRQRLIVSAKELEPALAKSNIKILNFGNSNFLPIFVKNARDEYNPLQGDFKIESIIPNEAIVLNAQALYGMEPGTMLETIVNLNDTFNADLIAKFKEGLITKKELISNISIYITEQGTVNETVGLLRAIKPGTNRNVQDFSKLYMIRKLAVQKALASPTARVEVGIAVPFNHALMSNPNVSVVEGEDGELIPQNIELNEESIKLVDDFGYILDGKVVSNKGVEYAPKDSVFARKTSKKEKNKGQKIPVVVFKYQGRTVVFPVSLKVTEDAKQQELTGILEDTGNSAAAKIYAINQLLIENNINPQDYNLSELESQESALEVSRMMGELSNIPSIADVDEWVSEGFNKNRLVEQVEIAIDITGTPFGAPKGILDFSGIQMPNEDDILIEAVTTLDNYAKKVDNIFRETQPFADMTNNTKFFDAFEEEGIAMDAETYVMHRRNAKILINSFKQNIPKAVRAVLGDDLIANIKTEIKQLETIEKGIKANKTALEGELKNEIESEQTNCE